MCRGKRRCLARAQETSQKCIEDSQPNFLCVSSSYTIKCTLHSPVFSCSSRHPAILSCIEEVESPTPLLAATKEGGCHVRSTSSFAAGAWLCESIVQAISTSPYTRINFWVQGLEQRHATVALLPFLALYSLAESRRMVRKAFAGLAINRS
jgi:hypothetical protein